jgi:hypothetical protein
MVNLEFQILYETGILDAIDTNRVNWRNCNPKENFRSLNVLSELRWEIQKSEHEYPTKKNFGNSLTDY